eukprot:jgi/Tetstr1/447345/TSEL_034782.t1
MELIAQRVLELLQEHRRSQTLRVSAVFRQIYKGKPEAVVAKHLDLVPVFPCDGTGPAYTIEFNGVAFRPKLDLVASIVQTWMDEVWDGGCVARGGRCDIAGSVDGNTVYAKKVKLECSPTAYGRKNVNRLVQEIMRLKNMAENMVE